MKMGLYAAGAATLTLAFAATATPAAAVIALQSAANCDIYDLNAGGCRFSYDANEHNDIAGIITAYNNQTTNTDLTVLTLADFLGKIDAGPDGPDSGDDPDSYIVTGFTYTLAGNFTPNSQTSWTINNLPFDVSLFTVKAAKELILFGLDPASDSFTAKNTSIVNKNLKLQGISHVSFYGGGGTAVPEPGTWALMILGFGGAGAMLRRRKAILA